MEFFSRGSRQQRHRRMEEEEYGGGGYEGEQYAGDGDQYTAMQVIPSCPSSAEKSEP